ncbi:MAG TPA: YhgE/Pip domain-containing protein, partial [Bacillota bacterium]|nr:YhgE/Pip domain-containing protein [Bacillota bacterium]
LKDGVREYINGVKDLSSGLREYQDGLIAYTDGVNELAEGVNEFEAETQDIDQQLLDEIDKKIDEYLNKDFVPESFVSAQNVNVESVQFVFTTEEIPKPKAAVIEVPKEENGNFWDRVAGLFGG